MFENLEVKDFKEAQAKYLKALDKQKEAHDREMKAMHMKHVQDLGRREVRIEELRKAEKELMQLRETHKECPTKASWDKARQEHREANAKWDKVMVEAQEKIRRLEAKLVSSTASATRSGVG